MKKIILLIIPLICAFLFAGCGKIYFTDGVGKDTFFEIDGEACSYQEGLIYLSEEKSAYEASFGNDMWDEKIGETTLEEYVKDVVKNKLCKIMTINLLAKEEGIRLNDEENEKVANTAKEYYSLLTDSEIEEMGITLEDVESAYAKYALSEKVFNKLTEGITSEVSDAEAKVIEVQSIFMKTDKDQMEKILKQIKDGEDFYSLANTYTEDDKTEYKIKKGETLPEFEEAAYKLKTGEISGIIETEKGFYIIKCVSDYLIDESAANKSDLLENEKEVAFQATYNPFADKLKFKVNNSLWKSVDIQEVLTLSSAEYYGVYEEYYK